MTGENEWIFALQQQQVLIPTLKIWAAGRSQKAEFATVQWPKTARNACKSKSIRVLHAATGTNLNLKSKTQSQQAIDQVFWPKKKSKTSLFPFPVLAPISSTVLFWIPLPEIFHLVRYPNAQFASTGTGRDSFVPFPVLGSASSGTVIHWAPYRNWTLCARSHFWYGALPVLVRSFTGPSTGTGLYA